MRKLVQLLTLLLFLFSGPIVNAVQEQVPLTIIVPSPAGSAPDIIARLIAEELRKQLGRSVIVDNKPGAGGIIAVMASKQAQPNGSTLLLAHAAVVVVTPLTYRAAKYDMEQDFETVAVLADTPMMFVSNPASGPKTLADLVAIGKSMPNTLTLGSTTRGSIPHLSGELLELMSGAQFNKVPMGSSGQAIQSVVSGDALVSVDGVAPLLPLVKAGRLHALAITSDRVLPNLEQFPLAKNTVPGLSINGWFMLFAPKGTPKSIVQVVNSAVNISLKSADVIQKLQSTGNYPVGGSVVQARDFLTKEKKLWAGAVQRAGLQPE
jgi:tripartite-type tricarboxylate transporter receptor subunit TctC